MIFLVLGCFLVVGAAVASILARDSVPVLQSAGVPPEATPAPAMAAEDLPVSNKEGKKDRLAVAALAAVDPQQVFPPVTAAPVRQAFASEGPVDQPTASIAAPAAPIVIPAEKPKLAAKPAVQKGYALLSDAQITAIKGRLNLSADQESYWPAVEEALRRVAKKIHEQRQAKPGAGGPPIDPESAEVQQLKSAAMPLLFQLREDQKKEVRSLARIIGLESVAAAI
jgi:hypothetical protein